jgi:hypothetical protein
VPSGEFCNQCGQALGGIALNLQQLSMAGEDFWVSAASSVPAPAGRADLGPQVPDESVHLAEADLPDWLAELPASSVPAEVKAHVYPSLKPIETQEPSPPRGRALTLVILLLGVLLLSLVGLALVLMLGLAG